MRIFHKSISLTTGGGEAGIPLDHFTSPWDRNELLEVEVEEVEEVETPVEAPVEAPMGFEAMPTPVLPAVPQYSHLPEHIKFTGCCSITQKLNIKHPCVPIPLGKKPTLLQTL